MTENRYVIEEIGNMFRVLKDNEPLTTKFENCDKQDVTNLIAELNELAEENNELKEENKELFGLLQEDVDSWSDEKKQILSDMSNAILGDFE